MAKDAHVCLHGLFFMWILSAHRAHECVHTVGGPIEHVCASPDGVHVAALCDGGRLRVANLQTRNIDKEFRLTHAAPPLQDMDYSNIVGSATGLGMVAVGGRGTEVEVWDVKGTLVHQLQVMPRNYVSRQDDKHAVGCKVKMVAFSSDARAMAVVHGRDKGDTHCQLSMWRLAQGKWEVESRVLSPHKDSVTSLTVSHVMPPHVSALGTVHALF